MPGMVELGEDIFLKPVRLGMPTYRGALADMVRNPRYATVMGLLEEARQQHLRGTACAQQDGSVKTVLAAHQGLVPGEFLSSGDERQRVAIGSSELFQRTTRVLR